MMNSSQDTTHDSVASSDGKYSSGFAWATRILVGAILAVGATTMSPTEGRAASGLQAGALVCKGDGGWGAIITSKKEFKCTFASTDGEFRGSYTGVIQKYGLDIGKTGNTTLTWVVFGPATVVGDNYIEGSLAGDYVGVAAEATVGIGAGAALLLGGSKDSFTLQPVSVQVQTGISIAAAVQTLKLTYIEPLQIANVEPLN